MRRFVYHELLYLSYSTVDQVYGRRHRYLVDLASFWFAYATVPHLEAPTWRRWQTKRQQGGENFLTYDDNRQAFISRDTPLNTVNNNPVLRDAHKYSFVTAMISHCVTNARNKKLVNGVFHLKCPHNKKQIVVVYCCRAPTIGHQALPRQSIFLLRNTLNRSWVHIQKCRECSQSMLSYCLTDSFGTV